MNPFVLASTSALLEQRAVINAELSRRAEELRLALHGHPHSYFPSVPAESLTELSTDGTEVRISYFVGSRMPEPFLTTDGPSYPPLPDSRGSGWGAVLRVPLAILERGAAAIRAQWDVQDSVRALEREKYEREEYEKLKAKFG